MVNTEETHYACGLKKEDFQTTIGGKKTDPYVLRNAEGNEVAVTNYGGAIVATMVPDKEGKLANVIQGHDNIQEAISSPEPYLSTLIGRYGNRVAKGRFQLNGKEYKSAINNGPNSLYGGKEGFNAKVWDAVQVNDHAVVLKYISSYGEEGYIGEVEVWVAYSFPDNDELIIKYSAKTNKKTIINLTSYGFFSLVGIANPTPTIDDLECQINADFYLPIDETSIPTGETLKVAGTPFDFREPKAVGQRIDADHEQIKNGAGYDHCFVLNKKEEGELSFVACIKEPKSGRTMEVYTTEPGVQVYTHNWADGYKGQHGATFPRRSAICFEAQYFPDSPNHPYFPSVILEPCKDYTQRTIYKLDVEK